MTIFVITGHLGSGKTLLSVRMAQRYLEQGRRVASNITLHPESLCHRSSRAVITKLPYIPLADHLDQMGPGYEGSDYDESKFGLLLLDEAGTWLNARDWADKGRRGLFQWITHARKKGWDVALIVQDLEALDAQIRRSISEVVVTCSRLDNIKVPFLPLKMPRVHIATARYRSPTGLLVDRWWTRGNELFSAYKTRESVYMEETMDDNGVIVDQRANQSLLSAWHLLGRYLPPTPTAAAVVSYLLTLPLQLVQLLSCGASPAAQSRLQDRLSQLLPSFMPDRARRVYSAGRNTAAPREPSRLVAHSMAAYRVKLLAAAR